ncbi:hypothetical protein RvY_12874 [Ramazzottius varieornatus]|uniref:Uncharacterized protein n=1 Tax=Ramazzottius varieornatus TaxID=947166 RepID=A0A1D1VKY9_RAMVA|nr:hypothetical protein RvY_12874 [Ramazzottius varieornatus]
MDPSYRSPLDPPKDWAKAYYKKPPAGKFYRFINVRNETFLAYFLIVTCTGLFWYPLIKPVFVSIRQMFKHPEILEYELEHLFKSSLSAEQKMEIRRNGGVNVHKLSDLWDNTHVMRWQPPTDTGQMTSKDLHMQEANELKVAALQKRNVKQPEKE